MSNSLNTRQREGSGLTQASFDLLLSRLGAGGENAANAYVELRRELFNYFVVRGATDPELLADETFDRVARRLSEGQTIVTENPVNYFYGVARNVWRECTAKEVVTVQLTDTTASRLIASATPLELMLKSLEMGVSERCLACLENGLARLSAEDRDLVVAYYQDIGGAKIKHREALASRLGVSLDSLRHRVARLRIKLGLCIEQCMRYRPPSR